VFFLLGVTATLVTVIPKSPRPPVYLQIDLNFRIALLNFHFALPQWETGLIGTLLGCPLALTIDNTSNTVAVSSLFLGYLLSFIAAYRSRSLRPLSWHFCMWLSGLGMLGFVNEALRLLTHYNFRFLVSLPPLLVLCDRLHTRRCERAALTQTATAIGESGGAREEMENRV
jgi:hypothetical protein